MTLKVSISSVEWDFLIECRKLYYFISNDTLRKYKHKLNFPITSNHSPHGFLVIAKYKTIKNRLPKNAIA